METRKHCAYNKTQESLLSLGVTLVDTTMGPFTAQIEEFALNAGTGLWLTPFRGIPVGQRLPPFDLLYLDEEHRVLQGVEFFSAVEFTPLKSQAASALLLPPHTLSLTKTHAGDRLLICDAEDMVRQLARISPSSPVPPVNGDHRARQFAGDSVALRSQTGSPSRQFAARPAAEQAAPTQQAVVAIKDETTREKTWKDGARKNEPEPEENPSLTTRFLRWLFPESDRRRSTRHPLPGLVAYYWTGGPPRPYRLGDISKTGFYLLSDERWTPGTIIQMTLQRTDVPEDPEHVISVQSQVVRWGSDGVGFRFVVSDLASSRLTGQGTNEEALGRFLKRLNLPEKEG